MKVSLLCWICLAFVIQSSAFAQQAPATPAGSEGAGTGLQEIVVTATKRSEDVQNVPITITALSAAEMTGGGIRQLEDLTYVTPGLTVNNQTGGMTSFIRGVGSSDTTAGQESPVAVYIDGVYQSSPYATNVPLATVDHIEVLKGPQGTLFGRNAAGGLINIITRDPSQAPELEASLAYGDYDSVETNIYATTGVVSNLATNVAVSYFSRDRGFGVNVDTGYPTYLDEHLQLRNNWLYTPTDSTQIKISADFSNFRTGDGEIRNLFPGQYSIDGVTTSASGFYNSEGNVEGRTSGQSWGVSAHIRQSFTPFQFVSISAYRDSRAQQDDDLDMGPLQLAEDDLNYQGYSTLTQEFQLLSNTGSWIKWIFGGFFMKDDSGFYGADGLGLFGPVYGGGLGLNYHIDTKAEAIFGETTIPLVADTNITLGARWSEDKRTELGQTDILNATTRELVDSIPLKPASKVFESPTWRAILDHKLEQDVLIFGSYSRGFKSGNFNTVAPGGAPFLPEKVDAFEIGLKSQFLENHLRVNGSVFYEKYTDIQLANFAGANGVPFFTNAPSAHIRGAELDAESVISPYFSLTTGISTLDAKFGAYPGGTCYHTNGPGVGGDAPYACDATGFTLPKSPKFTINIAPVATIPTPSGRVVISGNYFYSTRFYANASNYESQGAYGVANALIRWSPNDGPYSVGAYVKNLFNKEYYGFINETTYGAQYTAAPPRTYGIEFSVKLD